MIKLKCLLENENLDVEETANIIIKNCRLFLEKSKCYNLWRGMQYDITNLQKYKIRKDRITRSSGIGIDFWEELHN